MSQITRRLMVLVGALVIVAIALSAVGPVLAQEGQGQTVTIQEGDTLGDLFQRHTYQEQDLDIFANQNWNLVVEEGQTVTFPAGVTLDMDATNDVAGTTTDSTIVREPAVGVDQPGFVCDPMDVDSGETYVTQVGDTLSKLFNMMGYDYNVLAATADPSQVGQQNLRDFINLNCDLALVEGQMIMLPAGVAVTGQDDMDVTPTPTTDDTTGTTDDTTGTTDDTTGTTDDTTGTTDDTTAATVQDDDDEYTTIAADTLGDLVDRWNLSGETLREFLDENNDLNVVSGQSVTIPAGLEIDTDNDNIQDNVYTTQEGDDLEDIFGNINLNLTGGLLAGDPADVSLVESFVDSNRGLQLVADQVVDLPEGVPATGVTGQDDTTVVTPTPTTDDTTGTTDDTTGTTQQGQDDDDLTIDDATTLGELMDRYNLTTDAEIAAFVRANRGLRVEGAQTVTAVESIPATGEQQQEGQTTTQQGETTQQTGQGQTLGADAYGNFPSLNLGLGEADVSPGSGIYIVRAGDSLSSIARDFGTSIRHLLDLNPNTLYDDGNTIFRGQRIFVPAVENPPGGWRLHELRTAPPSQ